MEKINYKYTLLSLYLIIVFALFSLIIFSFYSASKNDLNSISAIKVIDKTNSIIKEFENSFERFELTLKSINKSKIFVEYINSETNNIEIKNEVEELFLNLHRTLPSVSQLRYLNIQGQEQIRINCKSNTPCNNQKEYSIAKKEVLQNKLNRDYFAKFLELKKDEIGISNIDLEIENNEVVVPKQISLRFSMLVFNEKDEKVGVLIINVNMNEFFEKIKKTTLYNVMIFDKQGYLLLHSNSDYGIVSENKTHLSDLLSVDETFEILQQNSYINDSYYVKKLDSLKNEQELRLLLQFKYQNLIENKKRDQDLIYLLFFILFITLLPAVMFFSKAPEKLKTKLKNQNITDRLTALPNKEALLQNNRKDTILNKIIILVKIDNFTKIANAYGNEVSNEIIKMLAKYLKVFQNRKNFLTLYKIDKDSFIFEYKFENKKLLNHDLQVLLNALENEEHLVRNDFNVLVDATISTSSITKNGNILDKIEEAEVALDSAYYKKQDIFIYDEKDKRIEVNKENIRLATKIKKAIENDEGVIVFFQPIYNNRSSKIEKYECLVRLKYKSELISPDRFIPIAKDIKKYKKLTKIIIEKSFEYFKNLDVEFSINLSAEDISSKEIRKYIYKSIEEYEVGNKLVIELVESEALENYDEFFKFIKDVKSLGCKIAIDDFGSGYSNYQYIINLNEYIDYLKIDGTLIKDIHTNRKTQLLVGTLKFLCDNLGIKTIAEYIENKGIFDYVKSMGIHYSQGYYIGKPSEKTIEEPNF